MTNIREVLRTQLRAAMKRRDMVVVSVCRSALAAIDNAEATPRTTLPAAGAVENSPIGVGAADAARRVVDEPEVRRIVESEIAEREAAASSLDAQHAERVDALRGEAMVLRGILG